MRGYGIYNAYVIVERSLQEGPLHPLPPATTKLNRLKMQPEASQVEPLYSTATYSIS